MPNTIQLFRKPKHVFLLLASFCLALLAVRILYSLHWRYVFLGWNLLLAAMPVFFAQAYLKYAERPLVRNFFLAGWFFFLPNAPYILTDYIHLVPATDAPFWFDWLLLTCFAWTGFLLGCWSVAIAWKRLQQRIAGRYQILFFAGLMVSVAFGVYLGRFERLNSWDIILRPGGVLEDALTALATPRVLVMTFLFSVFLILAWSGIRSVVREIRYE